MVTLTRTLLILFMLSLSGCGSFIFVPDTESRVDIRVTPGEDPTPAASTRLTQRSGDKILCEEFIITPYPTLLPLPPFNPGKGAYGEQVIDDLTHHIAQLRKQFRQYITTLDEDYQAYRQTCEP